MFDEELIIIFGKDNCKIDDGLSLSLLLLLDLNEVLDSDGKFCSNDSLNINNKYNINKTIYIVKHYFF